MSGDPGKGRIARGGLLALVGALAFASAALAVSLGSSHQMEYFRKQLDIESESKWKKLTKCEPGQQATGGAASTTANYSDSFITGSYPARSGHHGWEARGYKSGLFGAGASTYVFCAKKLDLDYVKKATTVNADASLTEAVACEGRDVAGGGVKVTGPAADVVLNSTGPIDTPGDLNTTRDDAWQVRVANTGTEAKTLTVHAVCAKRSANLEYFTSTFSAGLSAAPDTFQGGGNCGGSALTGAGVELTGTIEGAHIAGELINEDDPPGDLYTARASNDVGAAKNVIVTRICQPD